MEKEKEGVIATAKDAIADTAKAALGAAATGIEATKEVAVTAGTAVTEAVSSLATRARKAIQRRLLHGNDSQEYRAEGRRKEAGYEIDAQDGQGPQIRAGKAAGGEAQTQNCYATSIQGDEALERSLTRFLAGLGSCRVF